MGPILCQCEAPSFYVGATFGFLSIQACAVAYALIYANTLTVSGERKREREENDSWHVLEYSTIVVLARVYISGLEGRSRCLFVVLVDAMHMTVTNYLRNIRIVSKNNKI